MYEFTKKEIRNKFKETEYGKKTNKWLYIFIPIALFSFIVYSIIRILIIKEDIDLTVNSQILLSLLEGLTFISIILVCYFDGKRDGAIEQFKKMLKKDNK